jgi:predicted enzyme related to lactoylglutathione lyase
MDLGHLHIGFRDLSGSVKWMKQILGKERAYQNQDMAVFSFGNTSLIFDKSDKDSTITIAFNSNDCDADFDQAKGRGAVIVETPTDQPWGVRAGYIKGPGDTTIEIEQPLK